ncbi:MAG: glycerol kinase, partial [Thermoleophilaceae bacterium]|nr:glycerol kinase [Thermoleophilaceae bacterium]
MPHRNARTSQRRESPPMILGIDQGTTGTTCLVLDNDLRQLGRGYVELRQHFPEPGWVEQDTEEIWASVLAASEAALAAARVEAGDLRAIGITNQRETTLLWDRSTGRSVSRAIVWQDRRTTDRCRMLPANLIRERTGLVPDPYFSATKLEWLLERTSLPMDRLAFGTVDSWLVWKLTGGRVHVTDVTNAARTMLLDLAALDWDDEMLSIFGVERHLLPRVCRSAEIVGEAELLGATLPIAGIAGDQQASLFGHGCFGPGVGKATYGTGSFVLVNVGSLVPRVPDGLLATAAASAPSAKPQYAVEGAVLASGAA